MSYKIPTRRILLNIALFLTVISESVFAINRGIGGLLEYVSYAILISYIIFTFFSYETKKRRHVVGFICFFASTSIGFLLGDSSVSRKLILLFTTFAMSSIICLSGKSLRSEDDAKSAALSVLSGIVISAILAIVGGDGIVDTVDSVSGGFFNISAGLNFGIKYKNYLAADILAIFMILYYYQKNRNNKKKEKYLLLLYILALLILLSNSKGGILLFIIFLIINNYRILKKIDRKFRRIVLFILLIIGLSITYYIFTNYLLNISTYAFRYRGLINFFNYYSKDTYHVMFGIAEDVYDTNLSYTMAVRTIIGFDGSLEISWLNILIKSGFIGLLSYIVVYVKYISKNAKYSEINKKTKILSIIVVLLFSSTVEAYIQSIHCIFAVILYLYLNYSIENNS